MRISDWSSDVCASDLTVHRAAMHVRHRLFAVTGEFVCQIFNHLCRYATGFGIVGTAHAGRFFAPLHKAAADLYGTAVGQRQQIGRASCRERVCQYVLISVVAVSLKKKKKNKYT